MNKKKIVVTLNTNKLAVNAFDLIKPILFVFAVVSVIFTLAVRDANVVGSSMAETLHNGDKVILTDIFYTPRVGDIVAISTESLKEKRIIKRVIAKEGQSIRINYDTGEVIVDGIIIDEPYISSPMRTNENKTLSAEVPEGYIFVMGDNRYISLDSRDEKVGFIPVKDVIGKARFIFFPFDRIGGL